MGLKKTFFLCHFVLPLMVGAILAPIGNLNLEQTISAILWYVVLTGLSIPALCFKRLWPLKTTSAHTSVTYGVIKALSFMAFFYLYWLINFILGYFAYPMLSVQWFFVMVSASFIICLHLNRKQGYQVRLLENYKPSILLYYELPAALLFIAYLMYFSLSPDLRWGEKQMDYNLLSYFFRMEVFPPIDPWFFEKKMNYYYFGPFMAASMGKLVKLPVILTYSLSLASILNLFWCSTVSLFYRILKKAEMALAASFAFLFSCNFYALYMLLKGYDVDYEFFLGTLKIFADGCFAGAPIWYFFLKDLHAFMFNYPYIMCFLFIVISLGYTDFLKQIHAKALLFAFSLACIFLIHTWDFVIYGVVVLCFLIVKMARDLSLIKQNLRKYAVFGLWVSGFMGILLVCYLTSIFSGKPIVFNFYTYPSSNDLMMHVRFLSHLVVLQVLGLILYYRYKCSSRALMQVVWTLLLSTGFFILFSSYFIWMDRINTFFKIYNNIWVFLCISALAVWFYLFDFFNREQYQVLRQVFAAATGLLISCMLLVVYLNGYGSLNHDYVKQGRNRSLWGDRVVESIDRDAFYIIQWINKNISGTPHMVEGYGRSFETHTNLVSTYTGLPAYLGWTGHLYVRGISIAEIEKKKEDIDFIYNELDAQKVHALLRAKQIDYLAVTSAEYSKFKREGLLKFAQNPQYFIPMVQLNEAGFYKIK